VGFFETKPEFVRDAQMMGRINKVIEDAKMRLTIIAPYIDPGDNMIRTLAKQAERMNVDLVFRKDRLADYSRERWFKDLAEKSVGLFVVDRLHAKIYANEAQVMVGSANFQVSSWASSRECMLVISLDTDIGRDVATYISEIMDSAEAVASSAGRKQSTKARATSKTQSGHCIRCGTSIPLDVSRPYCKADYEKWAQYENPDFKDKHCHSCGKATVATMSKPLCRDCFAG
jgi:phosphatidylserine/phosphatidylglycerophosphate/cardiolipin synthase-like enzyme